MLLKLHFNGLCGHLNMTGKHTLSVSAHKASSVFADEYFCWYVDILLYTSDAKMLEGISSILAQTSSLTRRWSDHHLRIHALILNKLHTKDQQDKMIKRLTGHWSASLWHHDTLQQSNCASVLEFSRFNTWDTTTFDCFFVYLGKIELQPGNLMRFAAADLQAVVVAACDESL